MSIICVNGPIGSGKNMLCEMITREFPQHGFKIKAFADKLKKIVSVLSGREVEDLYSQEGKNIFIEIYGMTLGEMLQGVGTEMKTFDPDVWVKSLMSGYTNLEPVYDAEWKRKDDILMVKEIKYFGYPNWLICDLRYENELQACIERDAILVRIDGDPLGTRAKSKRDLKHSSETALDGFDGWHYKVNNNGTLEDLKQHAKNIIALWEEKNNNNKKMNA